MTGIEVLIAVAAFVVAVLVLSIVFGSGARRQPTMKHTRYPRPLHGSWLLKWTMQNWGFGVYWQGIEFLWASDEIVWIFPWQRQHAKAAWLSVTFGYTFSTLYELVRMNIQYEMDMNRDPMV